MYAFSKITASRPASKRFFLDETGKLETSPAVHIYAGQIETVEVRDAKDFADVLASLWPTDVLLYGLSDHTTARITTKAKYNPHHTGTLPIIPRSASHIKHHPRPGVLCLDYDPQEGREPLTHRELLQALYSVAPGLASAPMVLSHSASSYIYHGTQQLKGSRGKRVYVLIQDATDSRRAGTALFKRLRAAGYGWDVKTASGATLARTLIDRAMLSPVQIDYAAGAVCAEPLVQRRPEPLAIRNDAGPLDTREAIPDLPGEKTVRANRTAKAKAQAETARDPREDSPDIIMTPEESGLTRDTRIELLDGRTFTIHEIMKNRKHFQHVGCFDPVNPLRKEERREAILYVRGGHPCIRSFTDGGTQYTIPLGWIRPENTGPSGIVGPPRGLGRRVRQ